ncbi:MAG: SRPBCC family protein [Panacagrimonas sp.]
MTRSPRSRLPALLMLLSSATMLAAATHPFPAAAFDIQSVDVQHSGGRYRVSMRVTLDAPASHSYAVFADPARLRRVNRAIREVQVLEERAPDLRRIRTQVRACVGFFCRQLEQVQDMRYRPATDGGRIDAQVLPDRGDFRSGQATWVFRACGDKRTCLAFDAELEPAFWVPPLLGPWLIQRKLRDEAIETSHGLERLAREDASAVPSPSQ